MTKHNNAYPQSGPGTKSSSYLLLRGSTWYFRYALPSPLQTMLGGAKELKIALGTGLLREAKLKAGKMAAHAYVACMILQQHTELSSIPIATLKKLLKESVLTGNTALFFPADPQNQRKRVQRNCSTPHLLPVPTPCVAPSMPVVSRSGPLLIHALDNYSTEKQRAGAWTQRTIEDFMPKLRFFAEHVGNIAVDELRRDNIRNFKDIVDKLPARYGISKEFRDHTIQDICDGCVPLEKRMTPSSLSKYYGVINSFLIWLQKNYDEVQSGIEKILTIRISEQADLLRNVFSDDDISRIFSSNQYRENSFDQTYRYWLPIIGYYTGMRLEEICQLRTDDISCIDGIHCFDIHGNDGNSVKTKAGWRKVPIHPVIIERLRFLDFLEKQKNKGYIRFFPELQLRSGRYSHYASRWFNGDYLVKIGVKNQLSTGKVFHSFRHTFANACKLSGVDEFKAREILGHEVSSKSITYGRYGKKYPVTILFEDVIQKVGLKDISIYILGK